jgi:hypothetical protein
MNKVTGVPHTFHIPVMGLAYTIDTPIKVARFGIASVISIIEDRLVEMMRSYYYPTLNLEYKPISGHEEDSRAKRITDYLNLVNTIVQGQFEKLRNATFEAGSEIVKYFELLPDDSSLKQLYRKMMRCSDELEKLEIASFLRKHMRPGSIDVNIMTKLDRELYVKNSDGVVKQDASDAVAALRGYAKSDLSNSSVVFSAGINPRLFNYLASRKEFEMNPEGSFTKKVIVKVSDYRSALIQGKYLAKRGIWVSEFRIESGLNCGGHAFATEGFLLGPILEEFKSKKQELIDTLFKLYGAANLKKDCIQCVQAPPIQISVQGGIGTHDEDLFLHRHYQVQSTGWGTPFLLVPEATTVDEETLKLLSAAKEKDITLSHHSPLGVRFYSLQGTTAEAEKSLRICNGKPGSPCTEKHLAFNTEFTKEPICTASHKYQKLKIEQLVTLQLPQFEHQSRLNSILGKECLCVGLSNSAAITYNKVFIKKLNAVTICPGPNIVHFSKVVSLRTMVDHIYGRGKSLISSERPHMFIAELLLYIAYLKEQLQSDIPFEDQAQHKKYLATFYGNLKEGILYYRNLPGVSKVCGDPFHRDLSRAEMDLDSLSLQYAMILKA